MCYWIAITSLACSIADADATQLLNEARAVWSAGKTERALELADKAVASAPKEPRVYFVRAQYREALARPADAVADCDQCLKLDPKFAPAYDLRGTAHFKQGKFTEAVADFDKYLELEPRERPGHWRRGIALWYAGKFDEGAKQFEGYEKVDTNDVENAVWHFICVAKAEGVAKARSKLLKIGKDRRVPMTEVYELFAGKLKPEEVLAAAEGAASDADALRQQRCFAHLYLALYYDIVGDADAERRHIDLAADKYRMNNYMGDVARVHSAWLRSKK